MMMAMRRAAQRLTGGGVAIRRAGYAESRGVLSEEEKAAETLYIKRMEQERLEKARMKASEEAAPTASTAAGAAAAAAEEHVPKADPDLRTKSIAMGAGLVAVLCGVYFMFSSPPTGKKTVESKSDES